MAEQTVREQLEDALEGYIKGVKTAEHLAGPANTYDWRGFARDYRDLLQSILGRARAEPECGDACGSECPCYVAGAEAQREPAGRGTT